MREYLQSAKKELRKVSWPDRPRVLEMSLVVTGCTAIFAAYLWVVDIGIHHLLKFLFY
jgi:preprotein translocase subunit SecE